MSENKLDREDYRTMAQRFAELAALAIKEGDFGKADKFLKDAQDSLTNMRKHM